MKQEKDKDCTLGLKIPKLKHNLHAAGTELQLSIVDINSKRTINSR